MSQSQEDRGPVTTAEQAVAVFERFWRSELSAELEESRREWLDSLVASQTPSVARVTRADYGRRFAGEPLHGAADVLGAGGECWAVHYDGMLSTGLAACVDAATGEVLIAQEIPEG